ncbi:ras guanine nucleotide exchange factor domain-containing protein [Helicostylum pulchrum]|nr:ras guanine nucleotide exchange factor domain-containing protein [Helicostylum pulchrum]
MLHTVLPLDTIKRRSKSLDDLITKEFNTSPIITFQSLPKRRHSLYAEPRNKEYIRLATIYGWYTSNMHESNRRLLQTSRSFSHIPCTTTHKFTRMFNRSIKPNTASIEKILLDPPPPPIENDPHVFDLITKDSSHFIHYGKCDTTVTSATLEKLVEKLTREMDNDFLMDFFLTFRQFTTPIKLCKLLILRFRWALLEENDERRLVRIRTFVVIRHWLTHYWTYDFLNSRTLRFMLCTFLTQLQNHPVILSSARDERIIKNLRTVLKKQRKFYRDSCSRKDSGIGIDSNCPQQDENWTTKVKKSIKRTVSISSSSSSTSCGCKANVDCTHHHHTVQPPSSSPFDAQPPSSSSFNVFPSYRLSILPYKSVLLKYRSEVIAQHFCMIEQHMLQKISWDELVELRWRKRSSQRQSFIIDLETSDGVDQLIGYFNTTCQWVASEVVRSHHMETRVKVIEKLIRVALKCYHHRNYSTLMQILLGLQLPAVTRLERTWQKVDGCQLELFNQLKEMAKPFRNWKNVRDCMTKATEEVAESFAVETILTNSLKQSDHQSTGCIPFLGLYLSDLVFVAELPTFIDAGVVDEEDEEQEDKELCERLSNHLVNFNKFRITASVVKHVLAFQVLSRAYKFKTQTALYEQLQSMSLLDNSQIRKASFLCEQE